MSTPRIVIIGRPNVGKSSLFNLLAGRRVSIVDPTAGVTRDRISTTVEIPGEHRGDPAREVELIDTGGYGIQDSMNLTVQVEQQIAHGLAEADLVLFVIDAQAGLVTLDEVVARVLRQSGGKTKPILVVANKVDAESHEAGGFEAASLGFGDPVLISAKTKHHIYDLYDAIRANLDFDAIAERVETPDESIKLALVGKRNAGKSTLINALAGTDRVIVSEQPGTTRDSVDVKLELDTGAGLKSFIAIDTAGVRKTKSLSGDIEFYSQHRSLRSVRRADVCLLLIDAAVPISQVDHQLVNEINRHYRPTVVVVNKWDLAEAKYTQEEYVSYLDDSLKGLSFAPIVFISAAQAEGLVECIALAWNLYQQAAHRVGTGELNQFIELIMNERGPNASKAGKRAKIYYATQLAVSPPTIALFVNDPELFDGNYQRFLVNRIRDELPFAEVPIKLLVRGKQKMPASERIAQRDAAEG